MFLLRKILQQFLGQLARPGPVLLLVGALRQIRFGPDGFFLERRELPVGFFLFSFGELSACFEFFSQHAVPEPGVTRKNLPRPSRSVFVEVHTREEHRGPERPGGIPNREGF